MAIRQCVAVLATCTVLVHAEPAAPAPTPVGTLTVLLNGFEAPGKVFAGAWHLDNVSALPVPGKDGSAVAIAGKAHFKGAKADVTVVPALPPGVRSLSVWVRAPEDPARRPAVFMWSGTDAEGEHVAVEVSVDWTDWRRVELDLATATWKQTYKQDKGNGTLDLPLKSLHLNWFASAAGEQELAFDSLAATLEAGVDTVALKGFPLDDFVVPDRLLCGAPLSIFLSCPPAPQGAPATVEWCVFPLRQFDPPLAPDPVLGADIALGRKSWTLFNGTRTDDASLTDGDANTAETRTDFGKDAKGFSEVFQVIDLETPVTVSRLHVRNSDANWLYTVDVDGSVDGTSFDAFPNCRNVRLFHAWSGAWLDGTGSKPCRYVRLRYHTVGLGPGEHGPAKLTDSAAARKMALPNTVEVFDGLNGENLDLPRRADERYRATVVADAAHADVYGRVALQVPGEALAAPGAYCLGVRRTTGEQVDLLAYREFFVWAPFTAPPRGPLFVGVNASLLANAGNLAAMGFRGTRFENMKFFMCSPAADTFDFAGGVGPWHVNHDAFFRTYRDLGMPTLPMMLGVPKYASSKPDEKRAQFYPPRDPADYREFAFQVAARYGSATHPAETLKTADKLSGLALTDVFEIWNEPDLNHPQWGALVGEFTDYYPILRAGYEGVKRADPAARVVNGGLAGFEFAGWEALRTATYPDGKHPLDFLDVMNIHYYCGRRPPEAQGANTNIDRSGDGRVEPSFEDQLRELCRWRDAHKAGAPVWITEMGWDTIGGNNVTERQQAAYLPRAIMIAASAGADRFYIYRETDSGITLYASCGLVRKDGTFKPSAFTVTQTIRALEGMRPLGRVPAADDRVHAYLFGDGTARRVLAAWSSAPRPAPGAPEHPAPTLTLAAIPAKAEDAFGGPLAPALAYALGDFPCYLTVDGQPADDLAAAATEAAAQTAAAFQREAARKAVLLDFHVADTSDAFLHMGGLRPYTAVRASSNWPSECGFGFVKGPMKEETRKWVSDPVLRSYIRCQRETEFKARVPDAGRYRLELMFEPFGGDACDVSVDLDAQSVLRAQEKPDNGRTLTVRTPLDVPAGGGTLTIKTAGTYSNWFGLTLIEEPHAP